MNTLQIYTFSIGIKLRINHRIQVYFNFGTILIGSAFIIHNQTLNSTILVQYSQFYHTPYNLKVVVFAWRGGRGYWTVNFNSTQRLIIKFSRLRPQMLGAFIIRLIGWFKLAVSKFSNQCFNLQGGWGWICSS